MSTEAEDLRDIARKIEDLARSHPSWSMIHQIIFTTTDHIAAKARTIELREQLRVAVNPNAFPERP